LLRDMSKANSCKSCTCLHNEIRGVSSLGGGWKGLGVSPICQCGEVAVPKTLYPKPPKSKPYIPYTQNPQNPKTPAIKFEAQLTWNMLHDFNYR